MKIWEGPSLEGANADRQIDKHLHQDFFPLVALVWSLQQLSLTFVLRQLRFPMSSILSGHFIWPLQTVGESVGKFARAAVGKFH